MVGLLLDSGRRILVPEIADYEVRRELIRAGKTKGLARLDELKMTLGYLPITTAAMLKAAEFWAYARTLLDPLRTKNRWTLMRYSLVRHQATPQQKQTWW